MLKATLETIAKIVDGNLINLPLRAPQSARNRPQTAIPHHCGLHRTPNPTRCPADSCRRLQRLAATLMQSFRPAARLRRSLRPFFLRAAENLPCKAAHTQPRPYLHPPPNRIKRGKPSRFRSE